MIHLDHNATTPLDPEVAAAMGVALERAMRGGNPSSVHGLGRAAREDVEAARRQVAEGLGCDPLEVVFTSGGTEADNLAILGAARARARAGAPSGILTSPIEHPAVSAAARVGAAEGHAWITVSVDSAGRIDRDTLVDLVARHPEIGVVSLAAANHELGNAYPIPDWVAACRAVRPDLWFHTDAVQAVGKLDVDFAAWGVDLLSVSAHKLGGPMGVGALLVRRGLRLDPLTRGGAQERGFRPGTENVLGIVGFGAAVARSTVARAERQRHVRRVEARLREGLLALGARIHGDPEHTTGNTLNVAFPGCEGELVSMNLDLEGFAVSTGAACSSGSVEASPVLLALGLPPREAREAIRLSWAHTTRDEEIERLLAVLPGIVTRVRAAEALEDVG